MILPSHFCYFLIAYIFLDNRGRDPKLQIQTMQKSLKLGVCSFLFLLNPNLKAWFQGWVTDCQSTTLLPASRAIIVRETWHT